jgi:geranylgeranyl diphosphate synthase, type II
MTVYQVRPTAAGRLGPVALQTHLKAYAEPVDERLRRLLPSPETPPSDLHAAMRYSCLAPGKRLRPVLCMVGAEAVGGEGISVLDAACAIEMVHCFSLIHDDLPAIDNDDLRRGMPTCHKKFGEPMAILAGDALFALAFQTLSFSPHPAERVVRAIQVLTIATGSDGLVGGEVVDVLSEGLEIDRDGLAFIHSRKTGSLIAASLEIGAILSGGSEEQVEALRLYGMSVGLAFQIADDLLNETATPEQLGKAAGTDRQRRKATYPALYGIEGAQRAALRAVDEALEALEGPIQHRELLEQLARFTIERLN